MTKLIHKLGRAAAATVLMAAATAPAFAQDRWDWSGGRSGDREYGL